MRKEAQCFEISKAFSARTESVAFRPLPNSGNINEKKKTKTET